MANERKASKSDPCKDRNCPFHGQLSLRGKVFEGVVASAKAQGTLVVQRDYLHYVPKFMRYERRRSRVPAHRPMCLEVTVGDKVKIAECRPISKTVSFVVIERLGGR